MQTRRTRFLPKALTVELRRLPWRLLGASLVGIAAACWLALISWSYGDPSPSYATLAQPHNWLGRRGASVADALMQSFGLAAPFLVLPLAALGIRIASGHLPLRPRLRVVYWAAAALAVPAFFAMFPAPARWLLDSGLGGIVGDFIAARVVKLSSFVPRAVLWPGFGLLFLAAGAWSVFRACGLTPKVLSIALRGEPAKTIDPSRFEAEAEPQSADTTRTNKITSWVTRFSPRDRALTVTAPTRDTWLTKLRVEPRLTPAMAAEPRRKDVASPKPVRTGAPSPFADWGSRPAPSILAADELASLTAPSDLGSLEPSRALQHEPEKETFEDARTDVFEDIRIEPFFGPRRGGSDPESAAGGEEPEISSPLRRLTGNAIESARNEARRISRMEQKRSNGGSPSSM